MQARLGCEYMSKYFFRYVSTVCVTTKLLKCLCYSLAKYLGLLRSFEYNSLILLLVENDFRAL